MSIRRRLILASGIAGAYGLALLQPWLLQPGADLGALALLLGIGSLVVAAALLRPTPATARAARLVALLLVLICAASFLVAAAVAYAVVAVLVVPDRPSPAPPASPDTPHEFSPLSGRWESKLLPLEWAGGDLGAFQRGRVRCRYCGGGPTDPVHAPPGREGPLEPTDPGAGP
jgi:hypothetical protein